MLGEASPGVAAPSLGGFAVEASAPGSYGTHHKDLCATEPDVSTTAGWLSADSTRVGFGIAGNGFAGSRTYPAADHPQVQDGPWWELRMKIGNLSSCVADLDRSGPLFFPRDATPDQCAFALDERLCTRSAWGDPRLIMIQEPLDPSLSCSKSELPEDAAPVSGWLCFGSFRRKRAPVPNVKRADVSVKATTSSGGSERDITSSATAASGGDFKQLTTQIQEFMQHQTTQSADFRKQLDAVQVSGMEMRDELREQVKLCNSIHTRQEQMRGHVEKLDGQVQRQQTGLGRESKSGVLPAAADPRAVLSTAAPTTGLGSTSEPSPLPTIPGSLGG